MCTICTQSALSSKHPPGHNKPAAPVRSSNTSALFFDSLALCTFNVPILKQSMVREKLKVGLLHPHCYPQQLCSSSCPVLLPTTSLIMFLCLVHCFTVAGLHSDTLTTAHLPHPPGSPHSLYSPQFFSLTVCFSSTSRSTFTPTSRNELPTPRSRKGPQDQ